MTHTYKINVQIHLQYPTPPTSSSSSSPYSSSPSHPLLPSSPLLFTATCSVPTIPNMKTPSDLWVAGTPEHQRISHNNSIHFTCRHGYFRSGPHEATCTINGTWTTLPSCTGAPHTHTHTLHTPHSYTCMPEWR